MKDAIKFLALLTLIFTACYSQTDQKNHFEEEQIRKVFLGYKDAVLQGNGDAAIAYVNKATIVFFAKMQALALKAQEAEVRGLSPMNKMMVLSMRHRIALEDLKTMTPEEIFVYSINQGWVGKNSVLASEIGRLQIFGDNASAEYVKDGKATPIKYRFTKEDGKWKFDLSSVIPPADAAMSILIKKENIDEDEFVITLIESVSGKKVSPSVWQPLIK